MKKKSEKNVLLWLYARYQKEPGKRDTLKTDVLSPYPIAFLISHYTTVDHFNTRSTVGFELSFRGLLKFAGIVIGNEVKLAYFRFLRVLCKAGYMSTKPGERMSIKDLRWKGKIDERVL